MTAAQPIEIFTDGACSPNPGPGGYGVIISRTGTKTERSGGFRKTTNNRMEMAAAIEGLKAMQHPVDEDGASIIIYSDSRYLVNMFNGGYALKWRANGWRRTNREKALNTDLWNELLQLTAKRQVRFEWVKGHNEHPENERCDELAVAARKRAALPPDEGYENLPVRAVQQQMDLFGVLSSEHGAGSV